MLRTYQAPQELQDSKKYLFLCAEKRLGGKSRS